MNLAVSGHVFQTLGNRISALGPLLCLSLSPSVNRVTIPVPLKSIDPVGAGGGKDHEVTLAKLRDPSPAHSGHRWLTPGC